MSSNFSKKGCRGCYACVRVCPVDAIVIKGGQADILMDVFYVVGVQKPVHNITELKKRVSTVLKTLSKVVKL